MVRNGWFLIGLVILLQQCPIQAAPTSTFLRLERTYSDDSLDNILNFLDPRDVSRLEDLKEISMARTSLDQTFAVRYTTLLIQIIQKDPSDSVKNVALTELGTMPPTQSVIDLHTQLLTSAVLFPVHASIFKKAQSNIEKFLKGTESNLDFSGAINALDLSRRRRSCSIVENLLPALPN